MMQKSESSRKESSFTLPPTKTGTTHVDKEREVSPVNSSSNTEPSYSKKPQNDDLINSISALIDTRLTEFKSEMITMINKNGDQPMCFGDRDSYYEDFETNNLPEGGKRQNRRYPLR